METFNDLIIFKKSSENNQYNYLIKLKHISKNKIFTN